MTGAGRGRSIDCTVSSTPSVARKRAPSSLARARICGRRDGREAGGGGGRVERGEGNRLRPPPGVRDDAPQKELIAKDRHHDAGKPGGEAGGGGPCPAVMTDGPAAREQPIVRSVAD